MILCNKECIPCCDYCIHVVHLMGEINGKTVGLAPISCRLHNDKEHNYIAVGCGYCEDFHCENVT